MKRYKKETAALYFICGGVIVSIFVKKSLLRWRIVVNLAPCTCAGAVEYIVHSCSVLVAKPDLVARCIHRLDQSRILPACKSLLHWRIVIPPGGLPAVSQLDQRFFEKSWQKSRMQSVLRCLYRASHKAAPR